MYEFGLRQENRAILVGMSTYRNDQIERYVCERTGELGRLRGDIDARFLHYLHRVGIHSVGFDAGRVRPDRVGVEVSRPTFGHLTAARIAGAKEENVFLVHMEVPDKKSLSH